MGAQFSIANFLNQVSLGPLSEYLAKRPDLGELRKLVAAGADDQRILAAWQALDPGLRAETEADFEDAEALAEPDHLAVLMEETRARRPSTARQLDGQQRALDKALWLITNDRDFAKDQILPLFLEESFSQKQWHRFPDLPLVAIQRPAAAADALAKSVSAYYQDQTRGQVHREFHIRRSDGTDYFAIYLDDYAAPFVGFTGPEFVRGSQHPAFQVVFAYQPSSGWLDILAPGGLKEHQALAVIFGKAVLGAEITPEPFRPVFVLEPFLNRGFDFRIDVADRIQEVRVQHLRIASTAHTPLEWVTLEASARGAPSEIHDLMARCLKATFFRSRSVVVGRVRIRFTLAPTPQGRTKRFNFDIRQKSHTIKRLPADYRRIAEKYLGRWDLSLDDD